MPNGTKYKTYEEKQTDVNIAINLVKDAFLKESDLLFLVSNDSDISPAIRVAKENNKKLKIVVISPPLIETKQNFELLQSAGQLVRHKNGFFRKQKVITENQIKSCLF